MAPSLDTHILTVDANAIHKIDTANPESLFYIWSVFSRCALSVEQGRRLENLSWRLWQRKTLSPSASNDSLTSSTIAPKQIHHDSKLSDLPQLSGSVDSAVDEDAVELSSESTLDFKPQIHREDSCLRDNSQGKHDDFEKMVVSIISEKEPLTAPLPQIPSPAPTSAPVSNLTPTIQLSVRSTNPVSSTNLTTNHTMSPNPIILAPVPPTSYIPTESIASPPRSTVTTTAKSSATLGPRPTQVIRGFSPSTSSIPRMNLPAGDNTEPRSITAKNLTRKTATFTFGGSASSSEAGQSMSVEASKKLMLKPVIKKRGMFQVGGSSAESSAQSGNLAPPPLSKKKQTSFSAIVDTINSSNENAIASDSESDDDNAIATDSDEDEEADEDAIDDSDSDWEDSYEESGKSSVDERTFFARVDSKVRLPSRRSLITLMFNGDDQEQRKLGGGIASQSTSALHYRVRNFNGPSGVGPSNLREMQRPQMQTQPSEGSDDGLMMKQHNTSNNGAPLRAIREIHRSNAQPITAPNALSPRTTRRNMLATELTESLRRHMLWERQQKTKTMNAVLQRRHTSMDVQNLKQQPHVPYMNKEAAEDDQAKWNRYFTKEAADGYHTKGW